MPNKELIVINLFGAPAVGKSTAAAGLFWLMKSHGISTEYVSEYAKHLIHERRRWMLKKEQHYLFAQQRYTQEILRGQYTYAITDSPLQLCSFYAEGKYPKAYYELLDVMDQDFTNINYLLVADQKTPRVYDKVGRRHNQKQSIMIESRMRNFLNRKNIPYTELPLSIQTPWQIYETLSLPIALTHTLGKNSDNDPY